MNFFNKLLTILIVNIFIFSSPLLAEPMASPEDTVTSLIQDVKTSKNLSVVGNYIHWESQFHNLTKGQSNKLFVSSPEQLRSLMTIVLSSPEIVVNSLNLESIAKNSAARGRLGSSQANLGQKIEKNISTILNDISSSQTKILGTEINGNEAKVQIEVTYPNDKKLTKFVPLEKVEGRWYLKRLKSISEI